VHRSLRPRRWVVLSAALLAVAAGLVVTAGGSAQTPGARTVSLFEANTGATFAFVDNAPKSPVANQESRRFRFSMGDKIEFANPVLDRRGGNRLGVLYGEGTVMKGRTFANIVLLGTVTFAFSDGSQVAGVGMFSPGKTARVALIGGTGVYEGARGSIVSQEVQGGSQDTLTLLP
jgi:hypothetical protein